MSQAWGRSPLFSPSLSIYLDSYLPLVMLMINAIRAIQKRPPLSPRPFTKTTEAKPVLNSIYSVDDAKNLHVTIITEISLKIVKLSLKPSENSESIAHKFQNMGQLLRTLVRSRRIRE